METELVVSKAAVIGHPISHSLSPIIHRAGIASLHIPADYSAIDVTEDSLSNFIDGLGAEWVGLSLTMPLKARVLELIPEALPIARLTRSANTLYRDAHGDWALTNTDVFGIEKALVMSGHVTGGRAGGRALIVGSGATARSAAIALTNLQFSQVDVQARNTLSAIDLGELLKSQGTEVAISAIDPVSFIDYDLVISTLPHGVVNWENLRISSGQETVLLDVAYNPWPSDLAAVWSNNKVVSGIEMLYWQATAQFELFFGVTAPLTDMRKALEDRSA